jgi:hypothetical protein
MPELPRPQFIILESADDDLSLKARREYKSLTEFFGIGVTKKTTPDTPK